MTEQRRRRRRSRPSLASRVRAAFAPERGRARWGVLLIALTVALAAVTVVLTSGGAPRTSAEPPPSAQTTHPAVSTPAVTPRPTLPSVSASPSATPTPRPSGIAANRIRIERLDIDLRIVEGDGIDAPIDLAAHYPGTGWPDGGSNIYLYGHAQEGMFLSLWKAKVGDEIVLELVDETERRYLVTRVLPQVPWNALEYLHPTPTEQLTLQTSTSYTPTAPRFIVIAKPAP